MSGDREKIYVPPPIGFKSWVQYDEARDFARDCDREEASGEEEEEE
jgi:hypothetical protein